MPTIDLNVDFEEVKDADKIIVVPDAVYDYIIKGVVTENSKRTGRPMLTWTIGFNDPETAQALSLKYWSVLPWTNPETQEFETSGLGNLVSICKSCGKPWNGKTMATEDYVGFSGQVQIGNQKKQVKNAETGEYEDDSSGDLVNKIVKFL